MIKDFASKFQIYLPNEHDSAYRAGTRHSHALFIQHGHMGGSMIIFFFKLHVVVFRGEGVLLYVSIQRGRLLKLVWISYQLYLLK